MTQGKWTQKEERELDSYKFESNRDELHVGDELHDEVTIAGGEIVDTACWSRSGAGSRMKGEDGFEEMCRNEMRKICKSKPEELRNIYNLLTDEAMKSYCKELQKEIISELQEKMEKLQKTMSELEF